jgi:uncharacterized membrane protein YfcA
VTTLALVALAGFAAGLLAGLFGVGGGILFVPTLALGLGLSQLHAEATSLLAILPTVAVGGWTQHRYGNVAWRAALILGVAGVGGVEGGVYVAKATPEGTLRTLFGALMLLVAAQVAWRALRMKPGESPDEASPRN